MNLKIGRGMKRHKGPYIKDVRTERVRVGWPNSRQGSLRESSTRD